MNTYTAEWNRLLGIPVMIGCLGIVLAGLGIWNHNWLLSMVGYLCISYMVIKYFFCRLHRDDFVSVAENYIILRQGHQTSIIHAGTIREIEYGRVLRLRLDARWIDLSFCKDSNTLQYELVQFAVENGIYVHAFGVQCDAKGKYCRAKRSRQLTR